MANEFNGEQTLLKALHEAGQAPAINRDDAREFLQYLGGAPDMVFQFRVIDDKKQGRPPRNMRGTLAELYDQLVAFNADGFGVFVVINETANGGTHAEDVNTIRAAFVDLDGVRDGDCLELRKERLEYFNKIAPVSLMVESSPGRYHCYWFNWGMDLERFTPTQKELAAVLGGDPSICDLPRIMRVPGFLHRKGAPFLSHICYVAESVGRRRRADYVSPDVIEQAIEKTSKKFALKPPRKAKPKTDKGADLFDHRFPHMPENEQRICDALDHVPASPRDNWWKVGAALHALGWDNAREVWDDWSRKAPEKFDPDDQDKTWNGYRDRENGVTYLTIFEMAYEHGWEPEFSAPTGNGHDLVAAAHDAAVAAMATAGPAIVTAAALENKRFSPIKYIVKGYLVEGLTILAGRPKIGKSWLVLDWALAVADGGLVFDNVRCKQGDVLYLALEDNERRLQSRIGIVLGRDDGWPERFCYATEWPRAHEGGLDHIRKWIKEHPDARLVVVDVLQRFRKPVQNRENVYAADYDSVKGLQAIASETGVAVLIVMHLRKSAADLDPVDTISGSLGAAAGADAFLILNGKSPDFTFYGRGRDIVEMDLAVSFNSETCRWAVIGNRQVVRVTAERAKILDALLLPPYNLLPVKIAEIADLPRGNVRRLLMKMLADDQVLRSETGRYVHPDHPEVIEILNKLNKTSPTPPVTGNTLPTT